MRGLKSHFFQFETLHMVIYNQKFTSKRLNRSGPKFCVGPQKWFMDARNYKKLYQRPFDFCEIKKIFENLRIFLLLF